MGGGNEFATQTPKPKSEGDVTKNPLYSPRPCILRLLGFIVRPKSAWIYCEADECLEKGVL